MNWWIVIYTNNQDVCMPSFYINSSTGTAIDLMVSAFLSHLIAFNAFRNVIIYILSCVFLNFETCHAQISCTSEFPQMGSIIKVYIESVISIELTDIKIFLLIYIYFIILLYREQIMGLFEMFKRKNLQNNKTDI